jgi:xylan 1,4-beta-xylosidase
MRTLLALAGVSAASGQFNWCQSAPQSSWPICDMSASISDRTADIVSRLTIADKIQALNTATPNLPSINLPAFNWWSEGTHGA